jgi:light-regulated signal transduction histidine kinase (bacteriophytochrome)
MWRTLLSGQVFRGQLVNKRKDGSLYQAEAHIAPVRNPLGKITRFVSVKTDITKFVEAQRELESINQDLARSNAELEQFAYVASHDLQEPLRSVSSCLQLLKMRYAGQLDDRADEFIAHAVAANQRMRELIDALLALSRINADAALVPTNSAAVFSTVRENLAQSIEESGAQLTWEELPVVSAIPQMLGQLLQNLVGNAIKFRGDCPPVVRVGALREGSEWVFSISDQGIGIEPQHFERIFRLFQCLHTREEYTGTGLGLAICQKIVERHGGRIWLESQPGHGSTFFFTLLASH